MYVPAHFDESRPEVLHEFIADHPLGVLITHGDGGLDANHIPFELDTKTGSQGVLHGHVARANPLWTSVHDGDEVLVVFRGENGYISPSWYPSKHENHKSVPTWNYRIAHVHGTITVRDDERYVRGVVARLTRTHEAREAKPWKMTDAPPDYIDTMLKAIVGIEIHITRLEGKFKLSQNREARDLRGAANALLERGQADLGQTMLDHASQTKTA